MGSHGLATANARRGGSEPPLSIVELAAIICTALKSAFGAASAAETPRVQWKGSPGAAVMWTLLHPNKHSPAVASRHQGAKTRPLTSSIQPFGPKARARGILVCFAIWPSLSLFECNG